MDTLCSLLTHTHPWNPATNHHPGLMIVRPNYEDFRRLLVNLLTLASYSYDGADQGFLTAEFREVGAPPLAGCVMSCHVLHIPFVSSRLVLLRFVFSTRSCISWRG